MSPVDAGSIQRDIEKLNTPNQPPASPPLEQEKTAPTQENNISVKVTAFQFVGAKLLPEALLQAEVASYIGQTLDCNDLGQVTKKISELYRKMVGWLKYIYRRKIFKTA